MVCWIRKGWNVKGEGTEKWWQGRVGMHMAGRGRADGDWADPGRRFSTGPVVPSLDRELIRGEKSASGNKIQMLVVTDNRIICYFKRSEIIDLSYDEN
jgi:hypothetical protein